MLFTHVEAAISQIQTAETELNAHSGLEHGSISIGASETALNIYLLDILKPFHMKHPGIRLKIYNHSTPQAIRSVKNGEVDFAVVYHTNLTFRDCFPQMNLEDLTLLKCFLRHWFWKKS